MKIFFICILCSMLLVNITACAANQSQSELTEEDSALGGDELQEPHAAQAEELPARKITMEEESVAQAQPTGDSVPVEQPDSKEDITNPEQLPEQTEIELAPSTKMTYEELTGDDGTREQPPTEFPPSDTYKVEIDLTNHILKVFDAKGNPIRLMLCTIGKKDTSTPEGTFKAGSRKERFEYFDEFECYAQYWTQVDGAIYIHSVLYDEKDAKTLKKSSYRNLGKATSHGCIRVTVPDAKWIYENIAPGTEITVHKPPKDKALKASLALPEQR